MKLLFVTDQLQFGGAERHLVALATGLAQRGHEVVVAYLKDQVELADALQAGGVQQLVCCHSRGGLDWAAVRRLATVVKQVEPDAIVAIAHYSLMFATFARLLARRKVPLSFISHSMDCVIRSRADRLRFVVYRRFYRMADCVIFVSQLQEGFFGAMQIVPRRTEVVHNGIDLAHFDTAAVADEAAALRLRHGIAPDELAIGLCAIFREEKRHIDLLSALAALRRQGIAAKAVLVGDGPMRAEIEAAINRLGLRGAVVLAGFQQDVRPYIAMCDVMTLTSHAETFPMATLEYMAMGKPLVASKVGGLNEQVSDGVNGLLYPPGDTARLAGALASVADPALRARLGEGALATVRARFDVHQMVARYEAILAALAARGGVSAGALGRTRHAD